MLIRTIKGDSLRRLREINTRIIGLGSNIVAREFPIYIRYLKEDEIFASLYVPSEEYFEVGFNMSKKISDDFIDASWMKYDNIKYSINCIFLKPNLKFLFPIMPSFCHIDYYISLNLDYKPRPFVKL